MYFPHTRSHDRPKHVVWVLSSTQRCVYTLKYDDNFAWNTQMYHSDIISTCTVLFSVSRLTRNDSSTCECYAISYCAYRCLTHHRGIRLPAEYSNLFKSLGIIDVTFFKSCLCVIGSLLNQMLFVSSMNVNSDTAITEWVFGLIPGQWLLEKLQTPPIPSFFFLLLAIFSLSKHPSFSLPPWHIVSRDLWPHPPRCILYPLGPFTGCHGYRWL